MTQNEDLAALQAELDAIKAATAPAPAVYYGSPTEDQQQAGASKPRPRSARRGTSPIRTR